MDNDETHYPSASAEAIRAYYDVRDWESDVRSWLRAYLRPVLAGQLSGADRTNAGGALRSE